MVKVSWSYDIILMIKTEYDNLLYQIYLEKNIARNSIITARRVLVVLLPKRLIS